ncbi:MAG: sulfite exporter TauE/SafE family protein [Nanoarchaeota archaeon]
MTEKVELKISGMTCSSCEVLLERKLKEIKGVLKAEVNCSTGKAVLNCSEALSITDIQNKLKDTKYRVTEKKQNVETSKNIIQIKKDHVEIGAMFLIIFALYLIFKQFDILPNLGISENMSYGFVFLIGLVAAFSTCMAVSGGLLLAIATKYNEAHPNLSPSQKFKPHIYFNLGRIFSYTLLGGLLGALGSIFQVSSKLSGLITILASLIMISLGFQILNIFPLANKIKMPKIIAHKIHDLSESNSKSAPFLFGSSTFFLPCGFTQALQLYVLSTGDFIVGALIMLSFSLGTLPALLSTGYIASYSKGTLKRYFSKFVAVLIIILGFANISYGLTLAGSQFNFDSFLPSANAQPSAVPNAEIIGAKQVIEMKVQGLDYYPSSFNIKKGVPVEWRIDGREAQGCAQILSVPKLGIVEQLPKNKIKTITFTSEKEGTIKFSCSMGMAGPGILKVS